MKPYGKISEQDLDRLFSGKAPAEDSGLQNLARVVQEGQSLFLTGVEPEIEAAHLAGLMQMVNLTDKGDLAARPASNVTGPHVQASGLPKRRRRFMLESLFASLTAKLAAGGIAVAMAATGGLAGTGNLPDQAQTGLSRAAEKVGIQIPLGESAEKALEAAEKAAADALQRAQAAAELDEDNGNVEVVDGENGEPNENAAFGQSVAERARQGGVNGQDISAEARARAEERKAAGQANRPENAGPPANPGPPADAGSQSQVGIEKASDTPAAGFIPENVAGGAKGKPAGTPGGRP